MYYQSEFYPHNPSKKGEMPKKTGMKYLLEFMSKMAARSLFCLHTNTFYYRNREKRAKIGFLVYLLIDFLAILLRREKKRKNMKIYEK